MPRFSKIKWRDKDIDILRKTVKNFNAKIDRILKKNPYAEGYLPKKVSFKALKADIEYRTDFNKLVSSLKRFSRKGAEAMTSFLDKPMTKWERREGSIAKKNLNLRRTAKRKALQPSAEKGTLGTEEEMSLRHKKYPEGKTADWERFMEQMHYLGSTKYEAQRADHYLKNYCKAADNNMGRFADLIKLLASKMGGLALYNAYANNQQIQINYLYEQGAPQAAQAQNIIDAFADYGITLNREEKNKFKELLSEAEYSSASYDEEMQAYQEQYGISDDW